MFEEETNAVNFTHLRRSNLIAGYCLHLFPVLWRLEVIGSPSTALWQAALLAADVRAGRGGSASPPVICHLSLDILDH